MIFPFSIHYLDELEKEMSEMPGYKTPETVEVTKRTLKSSTDHGIVSGVDCYPANHRESDIILNHMKHQQEDLPLVMKKLALDGGYDVGAVHRGLELIGIDGYTAVREYQNNALKKGFSYNPEKDCFVKNDGCLTQHLVDPGLSTWEKGRIYSTVIFFP